MAVDGAQAILHVAQADAGAHGRQVEARTVIAHLEAEMPVLREERRRDVGVRPGVLRRVLKRLETAVVDRRLDLRRIAADAAPGQLHPSRPPQRHRAQRGQQPSIGEQAREDPVRQIAQLLDRLVEIGFELAELGAARRTRPRSVRGRARAGCAARRGAAAPRRGGRARAGAARSRWRRRCGCATRAARSASTSSPLRARRSLARAARSRRRPAATRARRRAGRRGRSPRPAARRARSR